MEKKFTQGEWKVVECLKNGTSPEILAGDQNDLVCRMYGGQYQIVEANAQLISAAPELLEVLELIVANHALGPYVFEKVRKAIDKAYGKE